MQICCRSAHVQNNEVAQVFIQQLGTFHHRARRGDDGACHHLPDVLHAWSMGDVLFKRILNDLPAGLYVQRVDLGVDILHNVELLPLLLRENQAHLLLILHISGVDDGDFQVHGADHLRIGDRRVPFAVVHAACDQNEVGAYFLDLSQISPAQPSRRNVVENPSRAQGRLPGGLGRHVVYQAVYRHLEAAGGRGCGQHLAVLQGLRSQLAAQVGDCALQADTYISVQYRSGGLALAEIDRTTAVQAVESVYHCCGGADLRYKDIYFHYCHRLSAALEGSKHTTDLLCKQANQGRRPQRLCPSVCLFARLVSFGALLRGTGRHSAESAERIDPAGGHKVDTNNQKCQKGDKNGLINLCLEYF